MGKAVTAQSGKMNSRLKSAPCSRLAHHVARLVRHCTDAKAPPTALQHLWHERHAIKAAIPIQRGKYFRNAPDVHSIASSKTRQAPAHA